MIDQNPPYRGEVFKDGYAQIELWDISYSLAIFTVRKMPSEKADSASIDLLFSHQQMVQDGMSHRMYVVLLCWAFV